MSNNQKYYSPLITIDSTGRLIIETFELNGEVSTGILNNILPLNEWCRLIITFTSNKWTTFINCKNNQTINAHFNYKNIYFNDVMGTLRVGGINNNFRSPRGYIGKLTIYRNKIITLKDLKMLPDDDLIFKLNIGNNDISCFQLEKKIRIFDFRIRVFMQKTFNRSNICDRKLITILNYKINILVFYRQVPLL
jgi:hypothetical protein